MKASHVLQGVMTRLLVAATVVSGLTLGVSDTVTAETECAGVTDQSRLRGMEPVPNAEGQVFPLVVIHGITGSVMAFEQTVKGSMVGAHPKPERSILDAMAGRADVTAYTGLPHTQVYSFEYTPDSLRWFTNSASGSQSVGSRFAGVIDCLFNKHDGVQVMVLAHSMGGLVTRWAANQTLGPDGQPKIGKVVTLGTPYLGSMGAALLGTTVDAGSEAAGIKGNPLLAAIVWWCGRQGTNTGNSTTIDCREFSSLTSEAGRALRAGSSEISTLSKWPDAVNVSALAGSIIAQGSLFGAKLPEIEIGDVIVGLNSATADADENFVEECRPFNEETPTWKQLANLIPNFAIADRIAQLATFILNNPCYHGRLMGSVRQSIDTLGEFNDWISSQSTPTALKIPSEMSGIWSGPVSNPSGTGEVQMTIDDELSSVFGSVGSCRFTLQLIDSNSNSISLIGVEETGCVAGGTWLLEITPEDQLRYQWSDSRSTRQDTGLLTRKASPTAPLTPEGSTVGGWPVDGGDVDGPPVLYVYMGSQLFFDDWVSCTDDRSICIVGVGDQVRVYQTSGIRQIAVLPIETSDSSQALRDLGISESGVAELLS